MAALFPAQDTFVRGELSPRLHARASLDMYRAGLSKCDNFITLPHGGIRKRGGTYFVAEVKDSSKRTRGIPFIFSADQAYFLEFGDQYVRVYAYGARVGTVEVVSPYQDTDLADLQFYQSADVMWIAHPSYALRTLTREAHTTWTLAEYTIDDGPYDVEETSGTTLTPSATGRAIPTLTSNTTPSGTASSTSGGASTYLFFDNDVSSDVTLASGAAGYVRYDFDSGNSKVIDNYYLVSGKGNVPGNADNMFTAWELQGSNDGSTWVTLDSRVGEQGWGKNEYRYFETTNQNAYRYYQLNFTGGGGDDAVGSIGAEWVTHERAQNQTPFNLTASSTTAINGGSGFQSSDVGRAIRLLGGDNRWRWARIAAVLSTTVVTIRLYDHALPTVAPISRWQLGTLVDGMYPEAVQVFEERLALSRKFSVYLSKSFTFEDFGTGEADDDGMEFRNAGGGQANDIVWIRDADGFLVMATAGGIRALSGSGIDEALTPSSFKNRRARTFGCAKVAPVDAGGSFLFVTRSRKAIAELILNSSGRFSSEDISQISEHIPKKGVVELAYQADPDPMLWFPLDNGELGGFTYQPAQEVRGMHRHDIAGSFSGSDWGIVESACVTPGQDGIDDLWLIVKRTINGNTKRYIEIMEAPFEYAAIEDAFQVDCGLTYEGAATGTLTGLSHLNGETVDVLATLNGATRVYRGLTVSGGSITLPGGATATKAHVGLPVTCSADTLELDVGGRDGSRMGRRKKVHKVILSLFETDLNGLEVASFIKDKWEPARLPSNQTPDGSVSLFTGNVDVLIDDSWEGQGRVRIRHTSPTPCTIRALTPVFDGEP